MQALDVNCTLYSATCTEAGPLCYHNGIAPPYDWTEEKAGKCLQHTIVSLQP